MRDTHWTVLDLVLEHRQMTAHQIASSTRISVRQAQRIIKFLRSRKKLYIVSWRRIGTRGSPTPVYAIGAAQDAPKPARLTATEYQRAWRERMRQSAGA